MSIAFKTNEVKKGIADDRDKIIFVNNFKCFRVLKTISDKTPKMLFPSYFILQGTLN